MIQWPIINARIHSGDLMVTLDRWSVYSLWRWVHTLDHIWAWFSTACVFYSLCLYYLSLCLSHTHTQIPYLIRCTESSLPRFFTWYQSGLVARSSPSACAVFYDDDQEPAHCYIAYSKREEEEDFDTTMNTQTGSALRSEKLDRNNFASWEYKMHKYLVGQGYWSYIEGAHIDQPIETAPQYATWVQAASRKPCNVLLGNMCTWPYA